ncbi:TorD/DmsD family molecular chaperone [Brevibacillus ginsengisoli]|uniref:TorD/DmsD family molecular chaperone n=1 Tax=Brevibacillus ginsengisoli TaxID=363854 RepID=UPI003CF7BB7B
MQPVLESREFMYRLLQRMFESSLDKELLLKAKDELPFELLTEISEGGRDLSQFFLSITQTNVDQIAKQEQEEFQRLFIGPNELPAHPWESVYRSAERILFDETTFLFRQKLHENGLKYLKENNEPEDHISIQLSFMAYLIEQQIQALQENNDEEFCRKVNAQVAVLQDHLNQWVFEFTNNLLVATDSLLYQGAAKLLRDFLKADTAYVSDIKGAIAHE